MSQTTEDSQPQFHDQQPSSPTFNYGCIFLSVFVGLLAVCGGVGVCGGFGGYFFLVNQVQQYTSESPTALPEVDFSTDRMDQLQTRLDSFKKALEEGQGDEPSKDEPQRDELQRDEPQEDDDQTGEMQTLTELVLTADEINALINLEEKLRGLVVLHKSANPVFGLSRKGFQESSRWSSASEHHRN
jgi:hypothetical protein